MKLALPSIKTPKPAYECVVIGAGIAGLVAANRLVRQGLSVLLVEQHYLVGGYCSSFRRKKYLFDAGSHFYPLLGNPQTLTGKLLQDMDIRCTWKRMDPVDQYHFPDGDSFPVPADWDRYIGSLKNLFPLEADNLDRFFSDVGQANMLGLLVYFRGVDTPRLDPFRQLSLQDALDRHFTDPKLKLLLTGDCPHWGSAPDRVSFVFDSLLRSSYFLGNYYPEGSSQAFANALGRGFTEHGGHLMTQTRMRGLRTKGHAVEQIYLEQGKRHRPFAVRTNALLYCGDQVGLSRMLPGELQSVREFTGALRDRHPSLSCFLTHIGARGLSRELLWRLHGYHWRGWDPNQAAAGSLKFRFFVPSLYDPGVAPEGCDVVIIQKILDIDYSAISDWDGHKARMEKEILGELTRMIPELPRRMEVCMSATAWTSYRYTLNHGGSMLGWEATPDQLEDSRISQQGPLDNLLFAGHWTRPGGGITPVIISAETGARLVAEKLSNGGG